MVDFHAHILPGVDDGPDTVENSLKMLDVFNEQNVNIVVSTSHFYGEQESIDDFLERRNKSYINLCNAIKNSGKEYPEIVLGAEVALTTDISKEENLEKLCIGDSNAILIELPYTGYSEWMTYAIYEIISRRRLIPVLAHFERFCHDKKMITQYESLLSLDLCIQVNADSFINRGYSKMAKYLAKNNMIDVIGSDAHNLDNRRSNLDVAANKIKSKYGKEYLIKLEEKAIKLLNF